MNRQGQALLIGVMILLLLLTAIPAIIFLNQHATTHGVESQRRLKARTVAEAGVAYAIQQLSQSGNPPPNWPYLSGAMPSSGTFTSMEQSSFTVTYTSTSVTTPVPGLRSYQVQIVVRPMMWNAASQQLVPVPGSSISAFVSPHTAGAKLPSGLAVSAALDLAFNPVVSSPGVLDVRLGPIVSHDPALWTLDSANNTNRRPRKFTVGGITGTGGPPYTRSESSPTITLSDRKEFWAYLYPGFDPVISTATYASWAQNPANETCGGTPPACLNSGSNCTTSNCYYTVASGDTIAFNAGFNFTCTTPPCAVYVNGNVDLKTVQIDLSSGAFIVDGSSNTLTLDTNGETGGPFTFSVPPTAALDDPYSTCGAACQSPTYRHIDLKGFLYSVGNLVVSGSWTLNGVVRVDGQMSVTPAGNFVLFYNDVISHNISTSNFELQVDSTTAIP